MYTETLIRRVCRKCEGISHFPRVTPVPLDDDTWFDFFAPNINQAYECHICRSKKAYHASHLERRESKYEQASTNYSGVSVQSSRAAILRGNEFFNGRPDGRCICLSCREEIIEKDHLHNATIGSADDEKGVFKSRNYCFRCFPREGRKSAYGKFMYEPEGIFGLLPALWDKKWKFRETLLSPPHGGLLRHSAATDQGQLLLGATFAADEEEPPHGAMYVLNRLRTTARRREASLIDRFLSPDLLDFNPDVCEFFFRVLQAYEDCLPEYFLFFAFNPQFLPEDLYKCISSRFLRECLQLAPEYFENDFRDVADTENWQHTFHFLRDNGNFLKSRDFEPHPQGMLHGGIHSIVRHRIVPAAAHPDPWFSASLLANGFAFLTNFVRPMSLQKILQETSLKVRKVASENNGLRYVVKKEYIPALFEYENIGSAQAKKKGPKALNLCIREMQAPDVRLGMADRVRECEVCKHTLPESKEFPTLKPNFFGTAPICFSCAAEKILPKTPFGPTPGIANPRRFAAYINFMQKTTEGQFVFPQDGHPMTPLCKTCSYKDFSANCLDCLMQSYIVSTLRNQSGFPAQRSDYTAGYFLLGINTLLSTMKAKTRSRGDTVKFDEKVHLKMNDFYHMNNRTWWNTPKEVWPQLLQQTHWYIRSAEPYAALEFLAMGSSLPEPILDSMFLYLFKALLDKSKKEYKTTEKIAAALEKTESLRLSLVATEKLHPEEVEPLFKDIAKAYRNRMWAVADTAFREKLHTVHNSIGVVAKQLLRGPGPNPETLSPGCFVVQDSWHLLMVALGENLRLLNEDGKPRSEACKKTYQLLLPALTERLQFLRFWHRFTGQPYYDLDWKRAMELIEDPNLLAVTRYDTMPAGERAAIYEERKAAFRALLEQNRIISNPDRQTPVLYPASPPSSPAPSVPEEPEDQPRSHQPESAINQASNLV